MPIAGPLLGIQIAAKLASKNFTGTQMANFSNAVGMGIVNCILASNIYQGTAIGVGTGAGVGTGTIKGLVGPVCGGLIWAAMLSKGIKGTKSLNTAMAIGSAFATHMKMGIVTSTSTPVANGVGIGQLKGIVGTVMGGSILAMLTASTLTGTQAINLAMAIGDGIAKSLKLCIVQTQIVGAGYPPTPTSGIDFGKLM